MYENGQPLISDSHFQDHVDCDVPIQVYYLNQHKDIGYVETYGSNFVKLNNTYYNRHFYIFLSRPGY
jgi:hypothetical protein